jgi:endonuclease/exonuclease/phosphatase family metal-dependent hydrolase
MTGLALIAAIALTPQIPLPNAPFQVMSFNIRFGTANDGLDRWEVRKDRTIQALKKRKPAIIGLQEALSSQVDELCMAMPKYQAVGVGRDDGRREGEFSAILFDSSRFQVLGSDTFWLSETPTVPNSKHWGNTITRICTWAFFRDLGTGKYFYHFNTHLDHQSQPSREKSVELILRRIRERGTSDPVILTGDFNVGEENPVTALVKGDRFQDTFRMLHPEVQDVGTFNGFKETVGKDKIDYVYVDAAFTVDSAEIVKDKVEGRWISDHLPVVATLRIRR